NVGGLRKEKKSEEREADGKKNVEMRWLISDANASEQPLKILQQEIPVFEESQHAQIHADAGNQPRATRMRSFCPAHLPAKPKIHCRGGKVQRSEGRIPGAVKDVASDY